jgi:hypothetical protein
MNAMYIGIETHRLQPIGTQCYFCKTVHIVNIAENDFDQKHYVIAGGIGVIG